MISKISSLFFLFAVISAVCCGRTDELVSEFIGGGASAFEYCLGIGGSICFFSGIMRVAEVSGLTEKVASLSHPFVCHFIPSASISSETENFVIMNIASNLFGLGNAATPFGIKAVRNMYTLNGLSAPDRSLATFMVMNTSSLCLIPSSAMALLHAYGSESPGDILLPVITVQLMSCVFGILLVRTVFPK